ncbi:MAG: acetate kinase [Lactobacillaceae bacterium]|jgi:acetate kinase|nr:acetate kinase [Lactobacillaceae bacterium]
MTKILSVNAGSSSLKFKLLDMPAENVIAEGVIERIDTVLDEDDNVTIKVDGEKHKTRKEFKDHEVAINFLLEQLISLGIVESLDEIKGVGHRVVSGGEWFNKSVVVDEDVLKKIHRLAAYAPLHNPANELGIKLFTKMIPGALQVAVFDTAFHQTMPEQNYLYGLPYEYYTKYGARKYGAHGTSHKYVSEQTAKLLGKPLEETKIVTLHIGAGASISAINKGKSVDTSMGFTPIAGLIMATRVGDVDVSLVKYIMEKEGLSGDEMLDILNNKSGLLGISTISSDMRDLEDVQETNHHANLAIEMFVDRIIKYTAQYIVELGGVDAIAFTAGVGENSPETRETVMKAFEFMGLKINDEANHTRGEEIEISTPDSSFKAFIVPTNEELEIARDVMNLMETSK